MKKFFPILTVLCVTFILAAMSLVLAFIAAAADPAVTTQVATSTAAVPQVSIIDWSRQNCAAILGIALGISELMGASPWFKGNGVIDSIIKSLKFLIGKTPPAV